MEVSYNVLVGDVRTQLAEIADNTVQCVVTSPPYWGLRDYGNDGQIGLEQTPDEFISELVFVFREVWRVLSDEGTLWLNIGDSYSSHKDCKSTAQTLAMGGASEAATVIDKGKSVSRNSKVLKSVGLKNKELVGIPWMLAFALRADGWYLRQEIIWAKPNPMPESVKDRCTKSHEQIFLLTKSSRYFFDSDAIAEPAQNWGTRDRSEMRNSTEDPLLKHHGLEGKEDEENPTRNKRSVWTVPTRPFKAAHFATFPPELIRPMILAGTSEFGKCDQCGNQFVRVIETGTIAERQTRDSTIGVIPGRDSVTRLNSVNMETLPKKHVGWEPSCECVEAKAVPCLVLDPFAGAGTTLFVANEEGRNAIGVELNDEYVKIIHARMNKLPQKLF